MPSDRQVSAVPKSSGWRPRATDPRSLALGVATARRQRANMKPTSPVFYLPWWHEHASSSELPRQRITRACRGTDRCSRTVCLPSSASSGTGSRGASRGHRAADRRREIGSRPRRPGNGGSPARVHGVPAPALCRSSLTRMALIVRVPRPAERPASGLAPLAASGTSGKPCAHTEVEASDRVASPPACDGAPTRRTANSSAQS